MSRGDLGFADGDVGGVSDDVGVGDEVAAVLGGEDEARARGLARRLALPLGRGEDQEIERLPCRCSTRSARPQTRPPRFQGEGKGREGEGLATVKERRKRKERERDLNPARGDAERQERVAQEDSSWAQRRRRGF